MLENAVAVITGASRGIGKAAAIALAQAGADVVCVARSTDAVASKLPGTIEETARAVEVLGRRALAVPCDLTREEDIEALADRTLAEFGRIDVLINNAAVSVRAPFVETTVKRWDLVLNVNLRGTVLCTKALLPRMIAQGSGRVINVSSGAVSDSQVAAALGLTAYAASKAAVEQLTGDLAAELAPQHIPVNCLRIETAVATEGARLVDPEGDFSDWATPEAVADALVWLATRPASYTGRVVTVADVRGEIAKGVPPPPS